MELNGQAKIDFEEWFCQSGIPQCFDKEIGYGFYDFPNPMKWGVYEDFFDSVGLVIDVVCCSKQWEVWIRKGKQFDTFQAKNRQEARLVAIKTACEIYNKNKK